MKLPFPTLSILAACLLQSCYTSAPTPSAIKEGETQFLLTSSTESWNKRDFSISHRDFPKLETNATWSVKRSTLHGGRQEGVELITIDNGNLTITVIPTRGMGILDIRKGDLRLGWDSPVKEVVHPAHVDLESRGGLGWLEGFNEWMVRCGLEFAGHPGTDDLGGGNTMTLTLHGKIQNIPASEVEVIVDPKPPHRIRVRGVVYEKFFYGPKLKMVAEISTVPGSDEFRIHDTVTNQGPSPQEFQIIYHGNYGSSILEAKATALTPAKTVTPFNDHAGKSLSTWQTYAGPTHGFAEEVYLFEPLADKNGKTLAVLQNAAGTLATSVEWNLSELPYLTIWKNTAAKEDGYVTGLEPATGYPFNRMVERKFGRVPKLAPGQTRSFTLDYGIHEGTEAVKAIAARVAAIQGKTPMKQIQEAPDTE